MDCYLSTNRSNERYKNASNTANSTIDDNSNVSSKNIGVLNAEIHKGDNILVSRGMITRKLKDLFPDFKAKQYQKDLNNPDFFKSHQISITKEEKRHFLFFPYTKWNFYRP